MANGPALSIDIVEKSYVVLPEPLFLNFHLHIEPSTVVGLVGPSGVGKSSLLRMIAGIDTDFEGTITVDGVPAQEAPPPGFVFQDARLLPWLTARDNIRAADPSTSMEKAEEYLDHVGLTGFEEAYPHELSGGMQRRVGLARAGSVNTSLLLLDEPFVSLDRQLADDLQQRVLNMVAAHQSTAVLVTHIPEDAARLCDRAIVLAGRPAKIVADLMFDSPRAERDRAELERLAAMIAASARELTA